MSLFSRFLRRSVLCLLCMISGLCAAQAPLIPQFQSVPQVLATNGRVTSFLTGAFQQPAAGSDFLYVNAPVGSGANSTISAGVELIGPIGQGFSAPGANGNQIQFSNVSNVVAALGRFNGDDNVDFAFALTPSGSVTTNLCVYYGTGAAEQGSSSSFDGTGTYPAQGLSGCMTFATSGTALPNFAYIAAMPFKTAGSLPQLLVEDSANKLLYVISNAGNTGSGGLLNGFQTIGTITLPDGAGPIYTGDFNGDGIMDFVVNGQTGYSATVYLGDGNGGFTAQAPPYKFDDGVRSMLMQDMTFDGKPDMVVETNHGVIEIHKGVGDGTFAQASSGGTAASPGSVAGNGGHLAAINPVTHDILMTTPIGLSLLHNSLSGLVYSLNTIYNIGPGRNSFALTHVYTTQNLDLVVDSPEGVAIIAGNADGTFQASKAYSALAPALGAVVGKFRNAANNPAGNVDVVVATGATQAQLLTGNGSGAFSTYPGVVDTNGPTAGPFSLPPPDVWSNILSGDFDGDGNLDVLYSLTGLPQQPPTGSTLALYFQYGKGDGTFSQSGNPIGAAGTAGNPDGLYLESAVGDFNGDGTSDVAMSDAFFDGTGLGNTNRAGFVGGFSSPDSNNTDFSQVAAGFFKVNRTSQQDVVFEQGSSFIAYVNKQDGTGKNFTAMPAITGPGALHYPGTVLLTDIDGDGFGDLVVVYYNTAPNPVGAGPVAPYQVWIWWGNGDGTFNQTPLVLNLTRNYYLGAVADMNGDGLPDLVLSDGSMISIVYNQGNRSFGTPLPSGLYPSEQHFLAGQGINSLTLADVNGDNVPDVVVANGGATISNALALGGKTAASIALAQNPSDINTGGITVLLNRITTKPVTGTLVATPEPSIYSTAFTMTATLTSSAGIAPTGQIAFYLDGTFVGTGPLAAVPGSTITSAASFTVPQGNTYAGVHPMSAVFITDGVNTGVTLFGTLGTHQIQGGPTTSEIFICIGPTIPCPAPPGVVNPPPLYAPTLFMSYGQTWNGLIDVKSNDPIALTGTIQLIDTYTGPDIPPPTPLCVLPVNLSAACPNSVGTTQGTSVGLNVLTAFYPGDANHPRSTSGPVAITVLPDTTSATLIGSPNPSPAKLPVTFTATVTGNIVAPTGPIAFSYGGQLLQQTNLIPNASGTTSTATFTTSALPVGNDTITASYGGTMNFNPASATFVETITPSLAGHFNLAVVPTPVSVGVGYATLLAITVTPLNGFSQDVTLSCANLPSEATCFFDSTTISGGSGSVSLVVSTTAPHSCGTTQPYFLGSNGGGGVAPYALPALAGLLAIFLPGKRRWLRALIAMVLMGGVTQMTGCGTCTDLGTRPATYTFQVTGAAANTSEVETQTVTITVTI